MMNRKQIALYWAVSDLLGPMMEKYGEIVNEGESDSEVVIYLDGYEFMTTIGVLRKINKAQADIYYAERGKDVAY